MSFYRIYRPQVIDEIDNALVREQLRSLLQKDKKDLPHAYLFTGPKGSGKTTAARVIAKLFNCEHPSKNGPCGSCDQCKEIAAGNSLDVIEMDAASNRGIDEIRQLRDRIGLSPVSAPYTVYIIDEVHMLTTEAFNALLKTLEEPPSHAVFVLATTNREKVPATIQSRCMLIPFKKAATQELTHALARIVKAEKMTIDADALSKIALAADGSFRDAVKFLEQVSFSKGAITAISVGDTLSLSDDSVREIFLSHLIDRNTKEALEDIVKNRADGRDMKSFLIDVLSDLEKKLVASAIGNSEGKWDVETANRAIAIFTRAFSELRLSPIPEIPIEVAIIEFCGDQKQIEVKPPETPVVPSLGLLTMEKLVEHWIDFIAATKPYNHSVAGVLRSSRPKSVENGIVTIEAFYKFHQEKLAEIQTKQILADVLKKLFGEKNKIEIVLGKK